MNSHTSTATCREDELDIQLHRESADHYRATLCVHDPEEASAQIDLLLELVFDQLGAHHLDLRLYSETL